MTPSFSHFSAVGMHAFACHQGPIKSQSERIAQEGCFFDPEVYSHLPKDSRHMSGTGSVLGTGRVTPAITWIELVAPM